MGTLHEQTYNLPTVGSNAKRSPQLYDFIKNIIGAEHTFYPDDNGVLWLDEAHSAGFKADDSTAVLILVAGNGSSTTVKLYAPNSIILGYHISKNGDVIYFRDRGKSGDCGYLKVLAAKDESGKWSIFCGKKMVYERGIITVNGTAYTDANAPFALAKATSLFNGMFTELYKVVSATEFVLDSTIVGIGGKPYRVVSVTSTGVSSDNMYPCYAFPVADSD